MAGGRAVSTHNRRAGRCAGGACSTCRPNSVSLSARTDDAGCACRKGFWLARATNLVRDTELKMPASTPKQHARGRGIRRSFPTIRRIILTSINFAISLTAGPDGARGKRINGAWMFFLNGPASKVHARPTSALMRRDPSAHHTKKLSKQQVKTTLLGALRGQCACSGFYTSGSDPATVPGTRKAPSAKLETNCAMGPALHRKRSTGQWTSGLGDHPMNERLLCAMEVRGQSMTRSGARQREM